MDYTDSPVQSLIPAGGVLEFPITVGSVDLYVKDQWQFQFFAEGAWWSHVSYKSCNVTEDDYDSGLPVIVNFMPQGWSVDLPVSTNCPNNSYDSPPVPSPGFLYYYDTGLRSEAAVPEWIRSLYENILSRVPSATEISPAVTAYLTMAMTGSAGLSAYRDAEVARMFKGDEYCTNQINELYKRLLGRVPSPTEIQPAVESLASGVALQSFMSRFCSGNEFIQDHPLPTAYTNAVFQLLLNRAPSDSELSATTTALQSGSKTPAVVCADIIQSAEFCDALVNDMFQTFLKRAPTSTEMTVSSDLLTAGLSIQVVSAPLPNCQEYLNDCSANAGS
jgi:hypothetical protein